MSEYISREKFVEECNQYNGLIIHLMSKPEATARFKLESQIKMSVCDTLKEIAEGMDSADVRPNIHGHWKRRTYIGNHETVTMFVCSECDKEFGWDIETGIAISDNNFCPNCGADMREPKGEKGKT